MNGDIPNPDKDFKVLIESSLDSATRPEDKLKIAKNIVAYVESMKQSRKMHLPIFDPLGIIEKFNTKMFPRANLIFVDPLNFIESKNQKCPMCQNLKQAIKQIESGKGGE